jgi:hypothetical protein
VSEIHLRSAPELLSAKGEPRTTPSGTAGLAGLLVALGQPTLAMRLRLERSSRVLLIATEARLPDPETPRV